MWLLLVGAFAGGCTSDDTDDPGGAPGARARRPDPRGRQWRARQDDYLHVGHRRGAPARSRRHRLRAGPRRAGRARPVVHLGPDSVDPAASSRPFDKLDAPTTTPATSTSTTTCSCSRHGDQLPADYRGRVRGADPGLQVLVDRADAPRASSTRSTTGPRTTTSSSWPTSTSPASSTPTTMFTNSGMTGARAHGARRAPHPAAGSTCGPGSGSASGCRTSTAMEDLKGLLLLAELADDPEIADARRPWPST